MKKFLLMVLAAMLMAATSVYGAQKSEKVMSIQPFSVLNVAGNLEVVYEQSKTCEVRLVGDANDFNQIYIENSGASLNIRKAAKQIGNVYIDTSDKAEKLNVVIKVKAPEVSVFNLAGGGHIIVDNMSGNKVTFNQAGSGGIALGSITANNTFFNNAGSGSIRIDDVKADNVCLSMAGSGVISGKVSGADKLNCTLTGIGRIYVSGKADKYGKVIIGSGSIDDSMLKYDSISTTSTHTNVIKDSDASSTPKSPNGIINAQP